MSCIHLLCGPVGAGKTTYARKLEVERRAVRLSVDEWMLQLFGAHVPKELFHQRLEACLVVLYDVAVRIVHAGPQVIVDGGFWRLVHRDRARFLLRSVPIQLYLLNAPPEVRWARLERRNVALPNGTYEITRSMFDEFEECFEPPTPDEPHVVVECGLE